MKDEYAKVSVPMLPVVRGEAETRRQILLYTVLLYAVTQLPFCAGGFGVEYLVASMTLGAGFIYCAVRLLRSADRTLGAADLPLLARLPGVALHLDADDRLFGSPAWLSGRNPPVDRESARRNMTAGLMAGASRAAIFALCFIVALLYMAPEAMSEHREIPEPGELVYAPRLLLAPRLLCLRTGRCRLRDLRERIHGPRLGLFDYRRRRRALRPSRI